nr:spore coat protein CotJB [Parablautia sp. Marseille-Q6255]
MPTGDRRKLFTFINEVSFAVYEALLYLDTHPDCEEALHYFKKYNQLRNRALKAYEHAYGPLVISVADESCSRSWEWMNQPWPWEGGMC